MITNWAPIALVLLILNSSAVLANDIYVQQVGDLLDMDITQDGENNQVEGLNGSGDASINGNNKTISLTQQGNTNQYRIWTHGGNQQMSATTTGNNNTSAMDNHGNNNNMTISITGSYNQTHTEIGNGGDNDNDISLTIDNGDDNYIYSEVQNGDYNQIDTQIHSQDDGYIKVTVNGNSNDIKAWQGKHEDGNVDSDETGDNEVYWIVSGNSNTLESYQTDDNSNGGQHIANYITGDNNIVKHTQRGAGDHQGFIEIGGDSNNVELLQRGNTQNMFADIVLDDGHTVDVLQRYGNHTTNIDLTNGGGGYNLDLDQTANTNQTYNITGTCTNSNGCGLTITQN